MVHAVPGQVLHHRGDPLPQVLGRVVAGGVQVGVERDQELPIDVVLVLALGGVADAHRTDPTPAGQVFETLLLRGGPIDAVTV